MNKIHNLEIYKKLSAVDMYNKLDEEVKEVAGAILMNDRKNLAEELLDVIQCCYGIAFTKGINLEEHIKEDLGINIKIEDYFNMSYRDRKKFIIQKEEELDELKYSIECGKFEEAQNSGYDTYEEYEEAMEWEMMEYDY